MQAMNGKIQNSPNVVFRGLIEPHRIRPHFVRASRVLRTSKNTSSSPNTLNAPSAPKTQSTTHIRTFIRGSITGREGLCSGSKKEFRKSKGLDRGYRKYGKKQNLVCKSILGALWGIHEFRTVICVFHFFGSAKISNLQNLKPQPGYLSLPSPAASSLWIRIAL